MISVISARGVGTSLGARAKAARTWPTVGGGEVIAAEGVASSVMALRFPLEHNMERSSTLWQKMRPLSAIE